MQYPDTHIPHDALLILSRARNQSMYGRIITATARRIPNIIFCEAVKFTDELLVNREINDIISDRSRRTLAIMDAPAEDFCDYPCIDVIARLTNRVRSAFDVALVVDMDWSNTIKTYPRGHKASPPYQFPNRPSIYRDANGPAELMSRVSQRYPAVTHIQVTDATIHDEVARYVQSL